MGQFSFQYPTWFIGICLLLAIIAGLLMYYKSRLLAECSFFQKLFLCTLRIVASFLILFLLLNPLYKFYNQNIRKPVLVFAQDVSASLKFRNKDPLTSYLENRNRIENELTEKYDLIHLEFADKTVEAQKDSFLGKSTNLNSVFDYISDQYDLENIKGLILATDGIYNVGKSPVYHSLLKQIPVYPIPFGDTVPEKDLSITSLFFNEIIYAGDQFALQSDLQAWNLQSEVFKVQLKRFESGSWILIQSADLKIEQNKYFHSHQWLIEATQAGIFKYKIECTALPGESNLKNNTREFYVEVLDSKKEIFIVMNSVHPDLSAIQSALNVNKNYKVSIKNISEPPTDLHKLSLLILHQLPGPGGTGSQLIIQAKNQKVPMLFIVGTQTDATAFNNVQDILHIKGTPKLTNEVLPVFRTGFTQFTLEQNVLESLTKFPPVNSILGEYNIDPTASILLFQKIGKVETNYPLWVCSDKNNFRISYILGDGIWKWKLNDYLNTGNFNAFTELINKTVQYTSTKEDKRKFRVNQDKRIFNEGESITFNAEFYNDNFERINIPDARITLTGPGDIKYDYNFSKPDNYYNLDAGSLPPGDYSYQASLDWNRKNYLVNGRFSIQDLDIENGYLVADFNLLRMLANSSGGRVYQNTSLDTLSQDLLEDKNSKPVISQNLEINPLIDQKWIFFFIFIFLAMEWFLRRFWGSY